MLALIGAILNLGFVHYSFGFGVYLDFSVQGFGTFLVAAHCMAPTRCSCFSIRECSRDPKKIWQLYGNFRAPLWEHIGNASRGPLAAVCALRGYSW